MSGPEPEFRGDFDVHLTVAAGDAGRLRAWARENGVKFTHMRTSPGPTRTPPGYRGSTSNTM
ncbi:hypothetical protein OG320_30585 [Microbispora sp. NBC_01189]|uniref:hypothetical protein n=1 Tax=Microbispora sp. NBC_01189 TaxID=2903583 RepID=UPI002E0EF15E|nr:hypothetical protein OG320_30585 [Microbispora sp. NBC_01189]